MLTNRRTPGRVLRRSRVRKRIRGTDAKPRLSVFRSARHIYAQLISDETNRTIAAASTLSGELRDSLGGQAGNREAAAKVGQLIARRAAEAGIRSVVFDRNGFLFHGRLRSLAEAAREAGLEF
ncbi:MAG: 50S ribosomal protein L18 [Deltaproteobacteria bacterium]|nr:50S ribosomal protein L18 [Deltaproteobacteria bacterium]